MRFEKKNVALVYALLPRLFNDNLTMNGLFTFWTDEMIMYAEHKGIEKKDGWIYFNIISLHSSGGNNKNSEKPKSERQFLLIIFISRRKSNSYWNEITIKFCICNIFIVTIEWDCVELWPLTLPLTVPWMFQESVCSIVKPKGLYKVLFRRSFLYYEKNSVNDLTA